MQLRALTLIIGVALVALVACSNDDDSSADSTSTPPAATAAATLQTPGSSGTPGEETPTGSANIPEVDDIIVAVLSGDPAKVRPRVRFETLACTTAAGPGGQPPCRSGEPDGTQVNVLEVGTCEGEFRRADELEGLVGQLFADSVYGVYAGPASQGPDGDYVAVFNRTAADASSAVAVTIDGGIIVYVKFACTETPEQLVELLGLGEPLP